MSNPITIVVDDKKLDGDLCIPKNATQLVLFVHGSGSSRHSVRNQYVAGVLNEAHIATLLIDLLTKEEDLDYEKRFDIAFLTKRVEAILSYLEKETLTKDLKLGLFGASTGAASAVYASVTHPQVRSIVSRGGRVDLAIDQATNLKVPILLIVGQRDDQVLFLNEKFFEKIPGIKKLSIIPNATHLFEEEGALEEVAKEATSWFKKTL